VSNHLPQETMPDVLNTPHRFSSTNLHMHGLHVRPDDHGDNVLVTSLDKSYFSALLFKS
jgi:hypothetical protein